MIAELQDEYGFEPVGEVDLYLNFTYSPDGDRPPDGIEVTFSRSVCGNDDISLYKVRMSFGEAKELVRRLNICLGDVASLCPTQ